MIDMFKSRVDGMRWNRIEWRTRSTSDQVMIGMGYDIINRRRGEKANRGKRDVVKRYVKRHSEILRGKSKFSLRET